jgi:uncharacterized repeat protein (TIGR03809 family)
VAFSRALAARWCALAERRLDHLTEMFESGRWRRYHTERSLLENIREAKIAVKTWRALSLGERIGGSPEISRATGANEPALGLPLQPEADLFETIVQPIALAPAVETAFAESDIAPPEDSGWREDSGWPDESGSPEDIVLPEDILLYQLVPAAPRIDMAALEQALSVGMAHEAAPLFDIDAIERRYPALRHAL